MKVDTSRLLNKLCEAEDIKAFLDEYENEFHTVSFREMINELAQQKNLTVASVVKKSGQSDYVYKVFKGERNPSRDIVISISVGMELSVNETQLLLRIAKQGTLDPRDKRDSIIIYGLKERLEIGKINDLLYDFQQDTL